jgi:ABC-type glycerol-3-phosphate transport system substrate-binding protein
VVVKQFPCEFLIRDKKQAPGFQVFTLNEAFLIPKVSKKKKETKEFLNFFINAENNESYNKGVGLAPTNTKSKPIEVAQAINFPNKADRDKFLWDTDYGTLASMRDEMIRRFETEIVPAIK